jgi:hypothetical protein
MKRILVVFGTLAVLAIGVYSCQKKSNNNSVSPATSNTATASRPSPYTFNEPEAIEVKSDIAEAMGYATLVLQPGDYTINFDDNSYGVINFIIDQSKSVKNGQKSTTVNNDDTGIGIRIAKRHQKNRLCDCCGGVGFRCGLVPQEAGGSGDDFMVINKDVFSSTSHDGRTYFGYISISQDAQYMKMKFTDVIDFASLDQ